MYTLINICRYTVLTILGLVFALPVSAQEQVRINSDSASIFIAPDSTQTLVSQAKKGEVFVPTAYQEGWVGIHMFSGEIRYVREADTESEFKLAGYHIDSQIKSEFCVAIRNSQMLAIENADSDDSESDNRSAEINLLLDRYILDVLREYEVPAVKNYVIMGCINDALHP